VLLADLRNAVNQFYQRLPSEEDGLLLPPGPSPSGVNSVESPSPNRRKTVSFSAPVSQGNSHPPPAVRRRRITPKDVPLNFVTINEGCRAVPVTARKFPIPSLASIQIVMDPSPYQIADTMMLSKVRMDVPRKRRCALTDSALC
jgi:hypothetical protein